ncbi:hypothetical protein AWB71_05298 [Caballeronia peredens]|nr:hypothetical protein AWB71_05298 [Caballeronia peredens]
MRKLFISLLLALPAASAFAQPSCYVVGDSIAYGVSVNLPCQSDTQVGINTRDALKRFTNPPSAALAIISLGINDRGTALPTKANLEAMRIRVKARRAVWILPSYPDKKAIVQAVASRHHDEVLNIDPLISTDGIHPTMQGYRTIAHKLQNGIK